MDNYIKGSYKKTIFKSDKGYVIGLFKISETNDDDMKLYLNKSITFTGYFAELNEDDSYIFYGKTIEHPRYGIQFEVNNYERVKPEDKDGLVAFLSSSLFKGIGESLAKSIVNTLGENVLDEILKDESCLLLVPKMTQKKAHKIYETLTNYEESHQITVYLSNLGFSIKDSLSIYNVYKKNTVMQLENNPYSLIDDVLVSFIKVDEIAFKLNIKEDDERRIKACIIYVMKKLLFTNSDTYLFYDEIYGNVLDYLKFELEEEDFKHYLDELINERKICFLDNKYYTKDMYDAEVNISKEIGYLVKNKVTKNKSIINCIEDLEKVNNIKYNDKQKQAIIKSLENNVTIITGGPGTGKTTIIKAICEIYRMINSYMEYDDFINSVALLAPTGRASKRMSESTRLPASTIHRFLKWNKETNKFLVDEFNKAKHKFIIVDEFSMVDLMLFDSLLKGLTRDIKLVIVGDHNQLPSVGPGNVLKDLIESEFVDTIFLEHLYRQDENSYIPTLAQEIKNNCLSENFTDTKSDYTFLKCNSYSVVENLKNLCYQLIDKGYDYKRVQIMAPIYATINGIDNINKQLQEIFNPYSPTKNEIKYSDVIYRENDKVLQLVNIPEENISNGDIGIIKSITKEDKKTYIYIDFDGNLVKYESKDLNKIKHGFVISIHKSQGSEFELAIILMANNYKRMLYKKLLYTAVTRAKKKLIIIGEVEAFIYSVNNTSEKERKTNLINQLTYNILK